MATLIKGNNLEKLKSLPDNSVDSVVTDPPYGLSFMGKAWDYDVPPKELWEECYRVLKPGGFVLSFSSARTYHRMAVNVEDAGFEIRDQIMWVYGSGFPKSRNLAISIDKKLAGMEHRGKRTNYGTTMITAGVNDKTSTGETIERDKAMPKHEPMCPESEKWDGWGTNLKPAHEPIVMARKPFKGSVTNNVLTYGTGAINIDDCRVSYENDSNDPASNPLFRYQNDYKQVTDNGQKVGVNVAFTNSLNPPNEQGRFPANLIHDGSDEVVELFPNSKGGAYPAKRGEGVNTSFTGGQEGTPRKMGDGGSAARFFYCPKASKKDRGQGNNHPTVKPIALMSYLIRLVTQPGGVVLDPYMGSGSTGVAAVEGGWEFIGMELDDNYFDIASSRIYPLIPTKTDEND